jgi:hypothetical protein
MIRVDLVESLSEMNESSHELELAQLGPRFPAERLVTGDLPYASLFTAIDDHLGSGGAERDIRDANGRGGRRDFGYRRNRGFRVREIERCKDDFGFLESKGSGESV